MLRKLRLSFGFLSFIMLFGCGISGNVFLDDEGVDGVTVVLSGDADMTTVTESDGSYAFDDVKAGSYKVTIQPTAGYTRSVSRKVTKENDYIGIKDVNFSINSETIRATETGQIIGFTEDNGGHAWLGIPYAKSDRWKAPEAAESWGASDTYMALELGPICTQFAGLLIDSSEAVTNGMVGCEDCQYLNLWAPADALTAPDPLPVMVWIHGGGNSIGEGGTYNGKNLATEHNLIVITFNYRLGPFGWFTHPALQTGDALDNSGNYGTLDIIRVLQWVQDNISYFGGDSDNVTVFGESAGALDTLTMVISGRTSDLFHKGIAESGGIRTTEMSRGQNYMDNSVTPGHSFSSREVVNKLLIADGMATDRTNAISIQNSMETAGTLDEYLYSKSNYEILGVYYGGYGGMISMPKVFRDGVVLPNDDPLNLFASGNYNQVPLMMGTNRDESKLFMILDTDFTDMLGSIPFRAKDPVYYELYSSYHSDATKAYAVDNLATILSEVSGQPPVYAYRFDWDEEPTMLGIDMSLLLGAAHGMEISFVFNNFTQLIVPQYASLVYADSNKQGRIELADSMASYWAEFAYTGDPDKGRDEAEVDWTAWDNTPGNDKTIIFDTQADGGIHMTNFTITPESLKYRLISETGFTTQEQHCEMYVSLFNGSELWDADEYANLGEEGCDPYP